MAEKRKGKEESKEKEGRKTPERYLVTFALTTLFFIVGILIGTAVTSNKMKSITSIEENIRLELLDLELQGTLAEYNPCGTYFIYALGERISDLGTKITLLEGQLGKNDKRVIELKKPYTLLMIQHYLLIKKRIEKCEENYITILFFYSNKPEFIDASEKQGYVLGYFSDKYGYEKIKVYAIDADLDIGIVKTLKEMHNITVLPATIVNDMAYVGFHAKNEFRDLFK